jgi:hypothetical protein
LSNKKINKIKKNFPNKKTMKIKEKKKKEKFKEEIK